MLAEFGGERVTGKARELADLLGYRVLVICSSESNQDFPERLIALGADEVIRLDGAKSVAEWSEALALLLKERVEIKYLLATSGIVADAILGAVYAISNDKISCFATGIDSLNEMESVKNFRSLGISLHFKMGTKANVFSLKATSIPIPFEDTSRYGKISNLKPKLLAEPQGRVSPTTSGLSREQYLDTSQILTVLAGKELAADELEFKEARRIASKYQGKFVEQQSHVEEIFGPCLALRVSAWREKDLPSFHGELIALISSDDQVICKMADSAGIITKDFPKVLSKL